MSTRIEFKAKAANIVTKDGITTVQIDDVDSSSLVAAIVLQPGLRDEVEGHFKSIDAADAQADKET